jgi:long-chain acyl-CoA synthetase
MVAYYAAARLRAVFVPINPGLTALEVAHIVKHSDTQLLLHDEELAATAKSAFADDRYRWSVSRLSDLKGVSSIPSFAGSDPSGDFLVIYTSGSTGTPKAVVFDQAAETRGNDSLIDMWGLSPSDVTLVALPLGFLYGLSTAAATGLQAGGRVVLLRKFHPRDVLHALVEHRVTIYHGVPTMFAMMLNYAEAENLNVDLSNIRLLISAGAPLADDLRARFERRFNKRIDDYYALTEARPVFGRRFDDAAVPPRGAIGRAAPGLDVRIVDSEGRTLGPGQTGELVLRASGQFGRYDKAPDLTERAITPEGFRTGDLGYYDEQGYYYLTGRIKDIIIRGGANIAPAEVENVLADHPDVQIAAVVGAPNPTFGEVVVAFVALRTGRRATTEELIRFCDERLAGYKVPVRLTILDSMPLGSTGKTDKNILKKMAAAEGS